MGLHPQTGGLSTKGHATQLTGAGFGAAAADDGACAPGGLSTLGGVSTLCVNLLLVNFAC